MSEGSAPEKHDPPGSSRTDADAARRLLREAVALASILVAVLAVAALERNRILLTRGYLSSLLLLACCVWYRWHFKAEARILPPPLSGWTAPVILAIPLVSCLLASAVAPQFLGSDVDSSYDRLPLMLLIVPLAEEFYFRGLLFEHLRRGVGTVRAVLFSSLLFALLHAPSGGLISTGILALLACLLVLIDGLVVHAVVLHVAWNGLSYINRIEAVTPRWTWAVAAVIIVVVLTCLRTPARSTVDEQPE
jgi:membrane protease YdiL (CAAX protease family)